MDARPQVVVSVPHRDEAVRDVAILDRGVSCLGMGVFDVHVARALHGGRDGGLGRNRAGGRGVRELDCRMRGKCDRAQPNRLLSLSTQAKSVPSFTSETGLQTISTVQASALRAVAMSAASLMKPPPRLTS